jgi:hypothetical protein
LARAKEALLTMPILKVSEEIKKYALEVIKVPITVLGDCPQCQSNGYRDGICPDCAFIDSRVQEAIAAWQQAMGIEQVMKQQQQSLSEQNAMSKAAYRSLAFSDMFPSSATTKVKCPDCNQLTFENDSLKKGEISGECKNPICMTEIAGETGFKRPKFLGIDPRWRKKVDRGYNFLSPGTLQIEQAKNKLKKKSAKEQNNPGAILNDAAAAEMDATTRMRSMQLQDAALQAQPQDAENSEEQQ